MSLRTESTYADSLASAEGDVPIPEENLADKDSHEGCDDVVFKDLDQMASVVCGTALKHALSQCTNQECDEIIEANQTVRELLVLPQFFRLSRQDVDRVRLVFVAQKAAKAETLLQNADDYENGTDVKRSKKKAYCLSTRKDIQSFKSFLKTTVGEKNWNFWLDIDRTSSLSEEEDDVQR